MTIATLPAFINAFINGGCDICQFSIGIVGLCFLKYFCYSFCYSVPSVLWRCWLVSRKGIQSVKKTEWWGAGVVICLEWGADLHMAQLMPLPLTVPCFSKIQVGFTFLVLAHLGSPGRRAVKRVCCVALILLALTSPGQGQGILSLSCLFCCCIFEGLYSIWAIDVCNVRQIQAMKVSVTVVMMMKISQWPWVLHWKGVWQRLRVVVVRPCCVHTVQRHGLLLSMFRGLCR